jgi:hypothetical protein
MGEDNSNAMVFMEYKSSNSAGNNNHNEDDLGLENGDRSNSR